MKLSKSSVIAALHTILIILVCGSFAQSQGQAYAPNGGVFTPKGTLKVLIVFVSYKDHNTENPNFTNKAMKLEDWDYSQNGGLPNFVDPLTGDCPAYIFNKDADFEQYKEQFLHNFSKEFDLMSNGQFHLIGEVFKDAKGKPAVVEIDPKGGYSWTDMNGRAVRKMQEMNPTVDLSGFDQRKNRPNFKFDNSDTARYKADKILDFVVFVHRYNKNWSQQPKASMRSWVGSGGGFASTGIVPTNTLNGYRIAEGFTMTYKSGVFVHEVAHVLFNAPHIMGVNNVIGDYFYLMSAGWGIMAPISIFSGFNAWERWYCGFIEPIADIQSAADLEINNSFILRDYFTTGDAVRIKIPFSGGQYLWLENHRKLHPLDEHPWKGAVVGPGDTVPPTPAGVYAFVEAIEGSRNSIFSALSNRANGIKVLHAGGNFDFKLYEDIPDEKNYWGNVMKSFQRLEENPIAGINNFYRFPYDQNKDGVIHLDPNYNASRTEWAAPIYKEEVSEGVFVNSYGAFGTHFKGRSSFIESVPFQVGDYLDMSSNPMPLNYPKYDRSSRKMQAYILNGLAIKFTETATKNAVKVTVKMKHVQLCRDSRWTGNIELPNITGDLNPDLVVAGCTRLILDKSGTPNTHVLTSDKDFIQATVFRVKAGATVLLKPNSTLLIAQNSKVIFEKGAHLIMEKNAKIKVAPNAQLSIEEASIIRHPKASIKE